MKEIILIVALVVFGVWVKTGDKPNSKPTYGDTGLPKNCRAIVKENIREYQKIQYQTIDYEQTTSNNDHYNDLQEKIEFYQEQMQQINGVFSSLDRNCGEFGWSWHEK